jgi:class 3 adenylate cyclase
METPLIPAVETDWRRQDGAVGLVFADIVGSTRLINHHGTEVYARILGSYRSRADRLSSEFNGWIVSRTGDEIFAAFPGTLGAYGFARGLYDDAGDPLLIARIGMHFGSVRLRDTDVVGRVVPLAKRIMEHAAPHELWMSDIAKARLEAESHSVASAIPWIVSEECVLKGIPDPQRLWRAA